MIEIKKKDNMVIYLDMDGVIANFFKAFATANGKNHWKEIDDIETQICKLKNTDFFNTLELYPDSKELVEFVKSFGDDWGICSSPLRGDHHNSKYWKKVWLSENGFIPPKKEHLVFTSNKAKWATCPNGNPNILIDDKPENIDKWIANGGIGIRYQANEDTLADIKNAINQKIG